MQINAVIAITFMGHLLNHSLTLIYPVIMIQLAQLHPETSLTTFGMIGSAHYLLYGLGSLPAGWLVDRFGAKTILIIYLLGSGLSVVGLVQADSLLQLTLWLTILGLFCSLYHPAGLTLISHNSMKISRHLGVHGMAGSLGLALGPLVSGLLAQRFGWNSPFIFFGILAMATGLYLWLWHPVENVISPAAHEQKSRINQLSTLMYVYAIGVFTGLAHRGTINFLPLHFSEAIEWGLDPVMIGGLLTALVLFSGIMGQALGGVIGDRYPRRKLILFVLLANIPFLLFISTTSGYVLVLMAILWGVVNFTYQPITNALITDLSSPANRGTLFGIFHGLSFGVGAFASTLAGYIGDRWDTQYIFLAMAVILLPAILLALRLAYPNQNKKSTPSFSGSKN